MQVAKKGVSTVAAVVVIVILIIVAAVLAYAYVGASGKSTTVTAISTQTTSATVTTASILTSTALMTTTATATSTATSISIASSTLTTVSTATTSVVMGPIITYSADAYATETTALLTGFTKSTGIPVAPVISGGSGADASAIEAGAPADVFVSSKLSATSPSGLGNLSAKWAIGFASDQVVVAYSNATLTNSAASTIVTQGQTAQTSNATSDWNAFYTALTSGSTKVGIANPVADPGGLRGWLALEIAGYLYSNGNENAYVTPLLKSGSNVTAASAADLVAPLQAGQIQFLFTYKSAALTAGLAFITLDSHVNLSSPSLAYFYSKFSYTDSAGKSTAAPIVIVVTVPLSSINTSEALEFVQYLVQNSKSLASYGLVIPTTDLLYSSVTAPQTLPPVIQAMLSQGLLVQAGPI